MRTSVSSPRVHIGPALPQRWRTAFQQPHYQTVLIWQFALVGPDCAPGDWKKAEPPTTTHHPVKQALSLCALFLTGPQTLNCLYQTDISHLCLIKGWVCGKELKTRFRLESKPRGFHKENWYIGLLVT